MSPDTLAELATVEPHILYGSHQDREARAQRLASLFIGEMIPLLVQVRQDFWDKEKDETICGVKTFTEYCTGVLRYSEGHIRRLIKGQNPASDKHNGSANRKPPQVKPAPEPAAPQQPIIDAEFVDAPDPQPAEAPLTVKDVLDWKDALEVDAINSVEIEAYSRNKAMKGKMSASFFGLTPAETMKLVEYFLQLKKAEPQPPSDPQSEPPAEPAPDINPEPSPSIVFCKAKTKKGGPCVQCSGLKDGFCPLHHPERIAERAAAQAKLKFESEFYGAYDDLLIEIRYPEDSEGREPTAEEFQKSFHKVCTQYKISPRVGLEIFEECSGLPEKEMAILREGIA